MTRRLALLLSLALGLGCSTFVDVERARQLLRSREEPAFPILVEKRAPQLPAPREFAAISGQLRSIPLRWDPLLAGDVGGYVIERTPEKDERYRRIAVLPGRFASHYIDRGDDLAPKRDRKGGRADLGDGATYCYHLQAFDSLGRVAAAEGPRACATTALPPAAPSSLRAYSHQPREVALSWNPSPDPTVVGYRVFRSPSRQGDYLPIARLEGRFATSYVDRGLGALRVFYYRVASVNAAGGVGKEAPEVRAVTKPEPLPPIGLRIEGQRLGSNRLAWDPNAEWDIDGYRLLRIRERDKSRGTVATVESAATRAEDRAVGAGERVSYRVVAFDRDGLESAPSDPILVESIDYGLEALPQEDAIRLRWSPEVQRGFAAARVLREGFFGTREIARVSSAGYVDRDVKPGHRYRYLVVLVREDGSEAPPSAVIEAKAPK